MTTQSAAPMGAMNIGLILQLASSQMLAASTVLKLQDQDKEGLEDLLGVILQAAGEGVIRYTIGDVDEIDEHLVVLRDALNSYLAQRGK